MSAFKRTWSRTLGLLGAGRSDAEAAAEFESHLAMLADEYEREGMPAAEAQRRARLTFGHMEAVKEAYRDQRSLPAVESFLQDARLAVRSFAKRRGFTSVAVLSLALGLGATTTIFTWLKAVYLNPLPGVKEARSLVTINAAYKGRNGFSNSYRDFLYIRDHAALFDGIFAHEMISTALSDGKSAEMTEGGIVSGNYFEVLGTTMALGRGFRHDEDEVLDRNPVVVLGYGLWQRRFGGDLRIAGRQVEVNRIPCTVIGVAAEGFGGVYGGLGQDFWIPMQMARALDAAHKDRLSEGSWMQIMARPRPGVTLDAIQSRLDVLSNQMRTEYRKTDSGYRAEVFPLHRAQRGIHSGLFGMVTVLAAAVGILLLLACLNVANLLIARGAERAREISVRLSLGATRSRIVRQLLTESILLGLAGGAAGLVLAFWWRSLPGYLSFPGSELVLNVEFDWRVFAFLFAVSLASAMLFGLLPALDASRTTFVEALKEGAGQLTAGRRRAWLRNALVAGQVALSTAALAGAALFAGHLAKLSHIDRGFVTENVLTGAVDLFAAGFDEPRGRVFYREAIDRVSALPDVDSAAWTTFLPMSGIGGGNSRKVEVRGYSNAGGGDLAVTVDTVSAGYLHTLGIVLEKGREFTRADTRDSAPVMLVNQRFVESYLQGREPVGAQVKIDQTWRTIVGVHRNYVYRFLSSDHEPAVFLPLDQDYAAGAILVLRTRSDPAPAAGALRRTLQSMDSGLTVSRLMTMEANVGFMLSDTVVSTAVLSAFGTLASILAAVGLYGVLSAYVNQRRREFAVRAAVGATPGDLRRQVLAESTRLTLTGAVLGLLLSLLFARILATQLVDMKADYRVFLWAVLGTGVVAIVSSIVPTRRASRMDPASALRFE